MNKTPTPGEIITTREAAGLTREQAAERFGYAPEGWRKKEVNGSHSRVLSKGEFELLQLLAGQHPDYVLTRR